MKLKAGRRTGERDMKDKTGFPTLRLYWDGHFYTSFPEGKLEAAGEK